MTFPTKLTVCRILMIPIFMLFFYLPFAWGHWVCAIIFALASFTDWLDGYLARRWNQTSAFGAFLDPVADKLLVVIALVLLVSRPYLMYISIPAAIIAGRELVVCAIREWMAEFGHKAKVGVLFVSKIKTAFQFFAIILLVAYVPGEKILIKWFGYLFFYISAILTLWTMVIYINITYKEFHKVELK